MDKNIIPIITWLSIISFWILGLITYIFFLRFSKKQYLRYFCKSLFVYIALASCVILLFGFLYLSIFSVDINYLYKVEQIGDLPEAQQILIINEKIHIKNIDLSSGSALIIIINILYFSAMTFFTVGYGDITISGALRILPIIESALGVGITTIYTAYAMLNYTSDPYELDIIKIQLSRGYDIVRISRKDKKFLLIELLSADNSLFPYIFEADYETEAFLKKLMINWNFQKKNNQTFSYYIKFSYYLISHFSEYTCSKMLDIYKYTGINSYEMLDQFSFYLTDLITSKEYHDEKVDFNITRAINNAIIGIRTIQSIKPTGYINE